MGSSIVYCVGDVHGRLDLLESLVGHAEDEASACGRRAVFVFLGDIVDRGPDSRGCMDAVASVLDRHPGSVLHVGNHDEWFVTAVRTRGHFPDWHGWLHYGGMQTLKSYGMAEDGNPKVMLDRIAEEFPGHLAMVEKGSAMSRAGRFVFAHAGIDPGVPLEGQSMHDLLWIRGPFLRYVDPDMHPVVHGHTIVGRLPVVTENRVSLDTGAYDTGRLTCCRIDRGGKSMSFLQTFDGGVREVKPDLLDRGYGTLMDRGPDLFDEPAVTGAKP